MLYIAWLLIMKEPVEMKDSLNHIEETGGILGMLTVGGLGFPSSKLYFIYCLLDWALQY